MSIVSVVNNNCSFWSKLSDGVSGAAKAVADFVMPVNPVTHCREFRLIPTCVEKSIGSAAYTNLICSEGGEISPNNARYGRYVAMVQRVGQALAAQCPRRDLDFEFTVIDSSVQNAWCLPGGKIGINLGLIQRMEEETSDLGTGMRFSLSEKIAAVLSHEITHAGARHGGRSMELSIFLFAAVKTIQYALTYFIRRQYDEKIEQAKENHDEGKAHDLIFQQERVVALSTPLLNTLGSWTLSGLRLCNSRRHELEADKFGMHLLYHTQDDKIGLGSNSAQSAIWLMHFFEQLQPSPGGWIAWVANLFGTHPSPKERLEANMKTWQELSRS